MNLLCIECSASPASAAIISDSAVKASAFVNAKITHSQTLLLLVQSVLETSQTSLSDIDAFAVASGPGSFTGVRIGISAIKGMAEAQQTPCHSISTLRAMAENIDNPNCIICAVMDARCGQFYNALFCRKNGNLQRLTDDRAVMGFDIIEDLQKQYNPDFPIIVVGDGAKLFVSFCNDSGLAVSLPRERDLFQNAVSVGMAVFADLENLTPLQPKDLQPVYLRLPQAERELKKKQEETK